MTACHLSAPDAPRNLEELALRAELLAGRALDELAQLAGLSLAAPTVRRKGKTGQLIEWALGARAGSASTPDFVHLGVELKTIPLDARGRPRESTFVCGFSLAEADRMEWQSSCVRQKLRHVLFVPILDASGPHVGRPFFWQPNAEQEAQLAADFDDILGLIAIGKVEELDAGVGELLQARPKAAHSGIRTRAYGMDGEPMLALPRGFYLRARFTAALVASADDRL